MDDSEAGVQSELENDTLPRGQLQQDDINSSSSPIATQKRETSNLEFENENDAMEEKYTREIGGGPLETVNRDTEESNELNESVQSETDATGDNNFLTEQIAANKNPEVDVIDAGSDPQISRDDTSEHDSFEERDQQSSPENSLHNIKIIKKDIESDDGKKTLTIHVLDQAIRKPYLGGFRHRLTGVEYHNASAQTAPKMPNSYGMERFHRDTQTFDVKRKTQQTFNDTSTQMTKIGCYVSDESDKVLVAKKYTTADEIAANRLEKVIVLQTYWRRWLATQYVSRVRAEKYKTLKWDQEVKENRERERRLRAEKEFMQRTNPRRKEDFDLLFAALEKWRLEEMEKINVTREGPERKAALALLMEQEAYLIQSIEKHKIHALNINKVDALKNFLSKAAMSRKWRSNYDGKVTVMDTPNILRAKQLRDLYNSLQMSYLTMDERMDILLTLKQVVLKQECQLTKELVELIDRETDLLSRGVKSQKLDGLRQRIITLFMQYCKTPLFNPEIGKHLKVPPDALYLKKDVFFCPSCNFYLPSSEFSTTSNARIIGRCMKCAKVDNDARLRQDFSKFRTMLRKLRQEEEKYDDGSQMAFYIQDADFHHLVANIWNSQSCLSAWTDLHDLVFLRWNKHEEWTPWNCILLTQEEAEAHLKLQNVNEAYGRIFIGKIRHRHVLARTHFAKLEELTRRVKEDIVQSRMEVVSQT